MSRHESVQKPCRKRKYKAYISYSCECNHFFTQGKQKKTKIKKTGAEWGGVGGRRRVKVKARKRNLFYRLEPPSGCLANLISFSTAAHHQPCLLVPCRVRLRSGVILTVATAAVTTTSYCLLTTYVKLGTVLNTLQSPPKPVRLVLGPIPFYR